MLLKIAMPAAIFCGVGYYGGTYAVSTDEINAYEQRMKAADGYLANGNYGKAIAGFIQASNQYDGSFRTSSYKDEALSQADVCFAKMQDQVTFFDRWKAIRTDTCPYEFYSNGILGCKSE